MPKRDYEFWSMSVIAIALKTLRFGVIECAMQIFQHLQQGVQNA
jgi:hypothetical protein